MSNVVPPWGHGFTDHEMSGSSRTISPIEQLFERVAELEKKLAALKEKGIRNKEFEQKVNEELYRISRLGPYKDRKP